MNSSSARSPESIRIEIPACNEERCGYHLTTFMIETIQLHIDPSYDPIRFYDLEKGIHRWDIPQTQRTIISFTRLEKTAKALGPITFAEQAPSIVFALQTNHCLFSRERMHRPVKRYVFLMNGTADTYDVLPSEATGSYYGANSWKNAWEMLFRDMSFLLLQIPEGQPYREKINRMLNRLNWKSEPPPHTNASI